MTATANTGDKITTSLNDFIRSLPSNVYSVDEIPTSVSTGFSDVEVGLCPEQFSEASGGKKSAMSPFRKVQFHSKASVHSVAQTVRFGKYVVQILVL